MKHQQLTLEENEQRLRDSTQGDLADELHNLGYSGSTDNDGTFVSVDEMDEDDTFDKLLEFYQLYPDRIPNVILWED